MSVTLAAFDGTNVLVGGAGVTLLGALGYLLFRFVGVNERQIETFVTNAETRIGAQDVSIREVEAENAVCRATLFHVVGYLQRSGMEVPDFVWRFLDPHSIADAAEQAAQVTRGHAAKRREQPDGR